MESLLLGELSPEDERKAREILVQRPDLAAEFGRLRSSDAEILADCPPASVAEEVRARLGRENAADRIRNPGRKDSRPSWWVRFRLPLPILVPAAAFALLMLLVRPWTGDGHPVRPGASDTETVRLKGGDGSLFIHRRVSGGSEALHSGDMVFRGQLLQLSLQGSTGYGLVFSIDGSGKVTRLWPAQGEGASRIAGEKRVSLPQSYELDDAPGFERFFLVTSPRFFPVDAVLRPAAAIASDSSRACCAELELNGGLHQTSILLIKQGAK